MVELVHDKIIWPEGMILHIQHGPTRRNSMSYEKIIVDRRCKSLDEAVNSLKYYFNHADVVRFLMNACDEGFNTHTSRGHSGWMIHIKRYDNASEI